MTYGADSFDTIPPMPGWVTRRDGEGIEDVAFLSGAALNHLHLVLRHPQAPQTLLCARLALRAAETCVTHQGRPERAGELRDALAFLQPGDSPGPAGAVYQSWRRVAARAISMQVLERALPALTPAQIAVWSEAGQGAPVARAAQVLQAVMDDRPQDPATALLLADVALAKALGWSHPVPLLGLGLRRSDLRKTEDDLRLTCHRAVVVGATEATRLAADLSRRAARVQAVTPKLRAKGSDEAVAMLLTQDAVAPTALTCLRSDRAARRFCDRLVELGVVRELTGRDTFRLFGV